MYVYFAIGILITSYILFLIWLFNETPTIELKVKDLKIPKRKFVLLALSWCQENLQETKYRYDLTIRYYPNKAFYGRFISWGKQIVIYIYPDLELIILVDTIIHEYIHHLQFEKKTTSNDYDKKLSEVGYWNNPYEMEARKIATQNRDECLKWIQKNHLF